jgi:hypothetical protein
MNELEINKQKILENEIIKIKEEYNNKINNYKNEINNIEINYKNIIENMKEEKNIMIMKFQEYLSVLEDKINYVKNEITIIYRINRNENKIRIFDNRFVKAKKDFCKILYN